MSLLTRRRLLNPKKGLPDIYQPVEYLWSKNAIPWIDTEYAVTTPDFRIEFKFLRNGATTTSTWGVDFSSAPREMHGHFYQDNIYYGSSKLYCGTSISTDEPLEGYIQFSKIYTNEKGKDAQDIEYQLGDFHNVISTQDLGVFRGTTYTDFLFGVNGKRDRVSCEHRAYLKIYYFKYFDDKGKLQRHFVPCYRKSDNKPGMFELVTQKFHVNKASSEFVLGPDIEI